MDDPRFTVYSAGLEPQPVAMEAVRAMNEIGIDISANRSKSLGEFMGKELIHHAIFLCSPSEPDCPKMYPFATRSHQWRIPAPNELAENCGSKERAFREVRDLIDQRIREWLADLDRSAA